MEGTLLDTAEEFSGNSCAVQKKIHQLELEKKLLTLQKEVSDMKLQSNAEKNLPNLTTIESLVPSFSGQNGVDISMWFEELERVFQLFSIDLKQKLVITLRLLSGTAQVLARASGLFEYNALRSVGTLHRQVYPPEPRNRQPAETSYTRKLSRVGRIAGRAACVDNL